MWNSINNREQAEKARRNAILGLFGLALLQAVAALFFWWLSIRSEDIFLVETFSTASLVALVFAGLGVILYFTTSRIVASILAVIAGVEIINLLAGGATSGNWGGLGLRLLLALVAIKIASTTFEIHKWTKQTGESLRHSKLTLIGMVVSLIIVLTGFILPVTHFWYHTRKQVTLVEKTNTFQYIEPADGYSFEMPKTWNLEQPVMQYGNVILSPENTNDVSVQIERWSPWSIPSNALYDINAFLNCVQNEADSYSKQSGARIDSIKVLATTTINAARVNYSETDGTTKYVQYVYNKGWSPQISKADWFFWRITAAIRINDQAYEKDVELILASFAVDPLIKK